MLRYISSLRSSIPPPTVEDNKYLNELESTSHEKKVVLPIVEADRVVDIFSFTMYDILALWLPVKDIVDKQRYWTSLVEAQETNLVHHFLKMTCNKISFYTRQAIIMQDEMTTSAQFIELTKISCLKNLNFNREPWLAFSNLLGDCALYKIFGALQPAYKNAYSKTYNRYSIIHADLPNDDMREMSGCLLLENFNSQICYKGSCKQGKDLKVGSGLDSLISLQAMLLAPSLQLD